MSTAVLVAVTTPAHAGARDFETRFRLASGTMLTATSVDSSTDGWSVGRRGGCCTGEPWARHWDGTRWHDVTLPSASVDDRLQAVDLEGVAALSAHNVWAVGQYVGAGGQSRAEIVHWDGTSWTVVPGADHPISEGLTDIWANSPRDIWAVGDTSGEGATASVEHWDGHAWSRVDAHVNGALWSVSGSGTDDVWAVGFGSGETTRISHWDGSTWSRLSSPVRSGRLSGVSSISPDQAVAVGYVPDTLAGFTVGWDGTRWSRCHKVCPQ